MHLSTTEGTGGTEYGSCTISRGFSCSRAVTHSVVVETTDGRTRRGREPADLHGRGWHRISVSPVPSVVNGFPFVAWITPLDRN
jgi:hypothetical protein